jgi:calcium/calmodulin-dependent protein kinase (CaM kinase) II
MSETTRDEMLALSRKLLSAIDRRDWAAYSELCHPSLTSFEPEAHGNLVEGLAFHEFYFTGESSADRVQSTISSPHVRLMGDSAVVTYVRVSQRWPQNGSPTSSATEETRVWQRLQGEWKHVHFHRSPCG